MNADPITVGPNFVESAAEDAVRLYDILDTPPEPEFDDITSLAAQICGTSIALVSLTDGHREWFKSRHGIELSEAPRHLTFCVHIANEKDFMVVPDTLADPKFTDHSFVTNPPYVRFYAGVRLITPEGEAIGTLCVADPQPRDLSPEQCDALRRLARQTVALLEARPVTPEWEGISRKERVEAWKEQLTQAETRARLDEENLKASEERYRRLFETAKDGMLILDAASGLIEDVNPFLCSLLGYEPSYFLGKQLWEIGLFQDVLANQEAFRELIRREFIRYDDLPLAAKDGRVVSVEFVSNVYESAGKKVIQCNVRDITAEKQSVTEQERFFSLSLDMLCIIDMDGYFRRVNPALSKLLGFTAEQLEGRSAFDFIHPDDYEESGRAIGQISTGYPVTNFVNRFKTRSGAYRSILWDTAPYGDQFYAAGRDITERAESARAVEESQRFLQATLDALISHIAVLDENGEIVAVNRAWRRFAHDNDGTAMSCGVGANYLQVCENASGAWNREAPEMARGIREVMTGHQRKFCLEYPCHSPSEERWFNVCVTRFPGSGPVRIAIAHDDITDRKQTENQIRTSEENLAKAQQIAHLGSWEVDLTNLDDINANVVRWSDEVFNIYGFQPQTFLPTVEKFFDIIHPGDRTMVRQASSAAIFGNKGYNIEHRVLLPDGRERFVREEAQIVLDTDGQPIKMVGTVQDISAQRQAEFALRESELRYRALAEAAPDDIFIIKKSGVLEYVNRHAAERFGMRPQDLIGKTDVAEFPPTIAYAARTATEKVFVTGEPFYEESTLTVDGADVWQGTWLVPLKDYDSNVLSVMGVARDISGQKQAEATLRESEYRYRSLFEANPHPMWVFDLKTLRFLAVNEAALESYGYSLDEFLSMTIKDIRPDEDVPAMILSVSNHAPASGRHGIWRHRKKSGSMMEVEVSTHELDFNGHRARLALSLDITKRVEAERALIQGKNELEIRVAERTQEVGKANEKLRIENIQHQMTMGTLRQAAEALQQAKEEADSANAAKSAFLSRMSHELRTPLNAILGFGQILDKQDLTPLAKKASVSFSRAATTF